MVDIEEAPQSPRLGILEASLQKKREKLKAMETAHYADVAQANGQPLNDKRGGHAVMRRWDRQCSAMTKQLGEIQKTLDAIDYEKALIVDCAKTKETLPEAIVQAMSNGTIVQWRKYPNRFFVPGVDKARIIWDQKAQRLSCSHVASLPDNEQYTAFRDVYNSLRGQIHG